VAAGSLPQREADRFARALTIDYRPVLRDLTTDDTDNTDEKPIREIRGETVWVWIGLIIRVSGLAPIAVLFLLERPRVAGTLPP
jgi:hypothetical protein